MYVYVNQLASEKLTLQHTRIIIVYANHDNIVFMFSYHVMHAYMQYIASIIQPGVYKPPEEQ